MYPVFDLHWHGRDEEQSAKETLSRSLAVAEASGVVAVAFMPNVKRPLTSLERCTEYLALADSCNSSVKTYVHIGLTPDVEQVKRAVDATRKSKRIIGMKAYWGKSTGDLTIEKRDQQFLVLETLAREGYVGVLASHCEKESEMKDGLYDKNNPLTWALLCRPEKAEIESYKDVVGMAEAVDFKGKIHVCHVSTTYVADAIKSYKGPLKLSCGITPHHFMFDFYKLSGPDGVWWKCNPALRSSGTRLGLEFRVVDGCIGIIESDHAPHTDADKHPVDAKVLPASGVPVGLGWPNVIDYLERKQMPAEYIRAAVFGNAVRLYGLDLEPREVRVDSEKLRALKVTYPFDPFK